MSSPEEDNQVDVKLERIQEKLHIIKQLFLPETKDGNEIMECPMIPGRIRGERRRRRAKEAEQG